MPASSTDSVAITTIINSVIVTIITFILELQTVVGVVMFSAVT